MLGFIVAIRNFIIALVLSWVGINFSPPSDDPVTPPNAPDKTTPQEPDTLFKVD